MLVLKNSYLFYISKIFDRLSLFILVTIKVRLLIKKLGQDGVCYDKEIGRDQLKKWTKLYKDLYDQNHLCNLLLPIKTKTLLNIIYCKHYIFYDASIICYLFAVYIFFLKNQT